MQTYRNERIKIKPEFFFLVAVFLMLLPFTWILSWLIAAFFHELCHYLALKLCRVQICSITVGISGAAIETDAMPVYKESISALAGPVGGLCLLFFARLIPSVAICALFQSLYNLLPIFPLDGGRVLRCCFASLFGSERGVRFSCILERGVVALVLIFAVVLSFMHRLGIVPIVCAVILLLRSGQIKLPCKEEKQIVQ